MVKVRKRVGVWVLGLGLNRVTTLMENMKSKTNSLLKNQNKPWSTTCLLVFVGFLFFRCCCFSQMVSISPPVIILYFLTTRRTADVRSVGYSELFTLSKGDVLAALTDFPQAQVRLSKHKSLSKTSIIFRSLTLTLTLLLNPYPNPKLKP